MLHTQTGRVVQSGEDVLHTQTGSGEDVLHTQTGRVVKMCYSDR